MEGFAGFGDEFPVVALCVKSELEDAVRRPVADLTREQRLAERAVTLATGAYDEFANAVREVGLAVGILRREALVVVIVTVDYDC